MTGRSMLLTGAALSAGLVFGQPAAAQVFEAGAAERLCVNGRVDPDRLAFAIISDARATVYAATANSKGDSPDELNAQEARYALAVINTMRAGDGARPFGPDIDPATHEGAKAAHQRILASQTSAVAGLAYQPLTVGTTRYRLSTAGGDGPPGLHRLFEANPPLSILCEAVPPPVEPRPEQGGRGATAAGANGAGNVVGDPDGPRWRVRGTVADLANQGGLADLKAASVGYARDDVAGSETATLTAVVGYRIAAPSGDWAVTPFVSYDYKEVTTGDDVDTLSPGLLLSMISTVGSADIGYALEAAYQMDREQSSEQLKWRLYVEPTFLIRHGDKRLSLFGQRFYDDAGKFWLFPDLVLIGDVSQVRDPGSNPAFVGGGDYWGYGAEVSIKGGNTDWGGFGFELGRRQIWMSGDLTFDEVARRYASLTYDFDESPLGMALTYSEGRDADTFKREDSLELTLTWRR